MRFRLWRWRHPLLWRRIERAFRADVDRMMTEYIFWGMPSDVAERLTSVEGTGDSP